MGPKVSIVLPLYNSEKFVEECVNSLLNQSFKDYELIILDDCSKDKTIEILQKMNISTNGRRGVVFIRNKRNMGFPRNVNNGIKRAKGEYIMIVDHDMVYDKNYLKKMISEGKDISAARCYYYKKKNKIRGFGIKVSMITGKTTVFGRDEIDQGQRDFVVNVPAAATGTLLVKKEVFERVGLIEPSFDKYYADIDFCLRARKEGYDIYLSKAKCWHKKEEKDSFNSNQLKDYYKDKKLFLKRHSVFYPFSLIPVKFKILILKCTY